VNRQRYIQNNKDGESVGFRYGQGQNRTADTRIFSSDMGLEPCVTNRHHSNEFTRLTSLRSRSIFRSKHMVPNGFGRALAKQSLSLNEFFIATASDALAKPV